MIMYWLFNWTVSTTAVLNNFMFSLIMLCTIHINNRAMKTRLITIEIQSSIRWYEYEKSSDVAFLRVSLTEKKQPKMRIKSKIAWIPSDTRDMEPEANEKAMDMLFTIKAATMTPMNRFSKTVCFFLCSRFIWSKEISEWSCFCYL